MPIEVRFTNEYVSKIVLDESPVVDGLQPYIPKLLGVVDSNAQWYLETSILPRVSCPYFVFGDPDERKKSQETVDAIHEFLFENKADRNAILLAVGGGITLDVAGYAASTYKRGINWIAVPTTLLAQVDASVGGKTAINHPIYGKNVIGSFHPPILVSIDSSCSLRWDDELRLEGIAEMYKIFKIFHHRALAQLIAKPHELLTRRSVELKADVVRIDPYEENIRAILNYGHTFGHALEALMNRDDDSRILPHGIAVSIGLRMENCVASVLGIMGDNELDKADQELDSLGLPWVEVPEFEVMLNLMLQDKKAQKGQVNLCLVDGLTEVSLEPKDPRVPVQVADLKRGYTKFLERRTRHGTRP